MKYLIVFILITFSTALYSQNSSFIIIEHIGLQNYPIKPFVISDLKTDSNLIEEHLTFGKAHYPYDIFTFNEKDFIFIDSIFSNIYHNDTIDCKNIYGSFKVTKYFNGVIFAKGFVCSRNLSVQFFEAVLIEIINRIGVCKLTLRLESMLLDLKSAE